MAILISSERFPLVNVAQIVSATGTALVQISAAYQVGGQRYDNLLVTNTDSIAHNVDFWAVNGGTNYLLGSVAVPAGTGKAGTVAVDAAALLVVAGQLGVIQNNQNNLSFSVEVAVVAGAVQCVAFGGVF